MRNSILNRFFLLGALSAALLGGWACSKDGDVAVKPAGESANAPPAAAAKPDAAVPDALRHAGYDYYGLGYAEPIEYEVVGPTVSTPAASSSKTTFVEMKDGKAVYRTERTGALAQFGVEEIELRPDGVFNTAIGGQPVEPDQLAMPADLAVGKSWESKGKIELQTGQVLEQSFLYKAVAEEKIQTKAGQFDAIKIAADGTIKVDGKTSKLKIEAWYVKGIGNVLIKTQSAEGTMRVEAIKTGQGPNP
jgi:hypothetical protein